MATTTTTVKPLLPVKTPVPSDIDIAQSIAPKHITQIAEGKLELRPDEYELYGPYKAKVRANLAAYVRPPGCCMLLPCGHCTHRPGRRQAAAPPAPQAVPAVCSRRSRLTPGFWGRRCTWPCGTG